MFRFRNFILLLIWGHSIVRAQFSADFSTWMIQDGNAFDNYEAISDLIVQPSLTLAWSKGWDAGAFRGFYEGAYAHFATYTQRAFQTHYGGFSVQQSPGNTGITFTGGFQGGMRANEDSIYAYYDYSHTMAYLNLRKIWARRGMTLAGFWMQQRLYQEIPQFDYQEFRFFVQQNVFFPTRTTLIARIQFGHKRFLETSVSAAEIQELIPRMDVPDPGETGGGGGGGNSGGRGGSGQGNGRGRLVPAGQDSRSVSVMPDTTYEVVTRTVRVESPGQRIDQWKFSLRLDQSIFTHTGLAVEAAMQRRADGDGRLISYQDAGYEEDDPLSDDPYNYNSDGLQAELSQKLPWGLFMKAGWNRDLKTYHYLALDLEGNRLPDQSDRKDTRSVLWLTLRKRFSFFKIQRGEISLSYSMIRNESNEAYSNYEDQILSLGWRLGL